MLRTELATLVRLLRSCKASDYPAPSGLGDRAILNRRDSEIAWLSWYEQEPSIIREGHELESLASRKRAYVERLDREIARRTMNRPSG